MAIQRGKGVIRKLNKIVILLTMVLTIAVGRENVKAVVEGLRLKNGYYD